MSSITTPNLVDRWADLLTDWLDRAYPLEGFRIPPASFMCQRLRQPQNIIAGAYEVLVERGRIRRDSRGFYFTAEGPGEQHAR